MSTDQIKIAIPMNDCFSDSFESKLDPYFRADFKPRERTMIVRFQDCQMAMAKRVRSIPLWSPSF